MLAIGDRGRASSRLRVWDHVESLQDFSETVRTDALVPMGLSRRRLALAIRLLIRFPLWCFWFLRARTIYIQETLILWPFVALLTGPLNKVIVFDFSDPIDTFGKGLRGRLRQRGFDSMVRNATHVIVENRFYQNELPRDDVHQVYGPVNTIRYAQGFKQRLGRRETSRLRIGWTGSPGTLKFVEPLFEHLDEIAQEINIELVLIGITELSYEFKNIPVSCLPWGEEREFIEVPKFDLGLHALDTSPTALKRGAGKLFIYMAAGVPFITDAAGIGADVAKESGIGTLVAEKSEWPEMLRKIIYDSETRKIHSIEGMEYARKYMSYQAFRNLLNRLLINKNNCKSQQSVDAPFSDK